MNKQRFFSARNITMLSVLIALVVILQVFAGSIPVGATGAQLNFTLVPIVLGAILLGWISGAILGFACGIVVLIQVILGQNEFYVLIWTSAPVVTVFICILKTTVAGMVAGLLYKLIAKRNTLVAIFVVSATVPIINTSLFIIGCLCMWDTIASIAGGSNVFGFILVGIVSFNFFIELAINLILAPALSRVITAVEKSVGRHYQARPKKIKHVDAGNDSQQVTDTKEGK